MGEKIFFYKGLLFIVDIGVFKNHGFISPEQIVTNESLRKRREEKFEGLCSDMRGKGGITR